MTMKKKQVSLPDKPSALIRLALRDLEKVEKVPAHYRVGMDEAFHCGMDGSEPCVVCFAGAVMAKTLGAGWKDPTIYVGSFPENSKKLHSLDYFRTGRLDDAFNQLGRQRPDGVPFYFDVRSYGPRALARRAFKHDMRKLAALLAKAGA